MGKLYDVTREGNSFLVHFKTTKELSFFYYIRKDNSIWYKGYLFCKHIDASSILRGSETIGNSLLSVFVEIIIELKMNILCVLLISFTACQDKIAVLCVYIVVI